jgi:hypothetical protein
MDKPSKVFSDLVAAGKVKKGEVYGVFSVQGYVDDAIMLKQGELVMAIDQYS